MLKLYIKYIFYTFSGGGVVRVIGVKALNVFGMNERKRETENSQHVYPMLFIIDDE